MQHPPDSDHQPPHSPVTTAPLLPNQSLSQWYRVQRKRTKLALGCGCSALLAMLLLCSCIGSIAIVGKVVSTAKTLTSTPIVTSTTILIPTPTSTHNPTATPTHTPMPIPTSASTPTPTTTIAVYIGSNVSAFQALYGPKGDTGLKGSIIWDLSKTEWFTITFDPDQRHVYDLDHYFYPADQAGNHQQDNVSFEVAHQTCSRFMPPDSALISVNKTKPDPSLTDGVQYVFKSKWLAHQIDTSLFYFDEGTGVMNDKYNTPVDPGTYTLFYIGSERSGYEMCFLTTGVSWPY